MMKKKVRKGREGVDGSKSARRVTVVWEFLRLRNFGQADIL